MAFLNKAGSSAAALQYLLIFAGTLPRTLQVRLSSLIACALQSLPRCPYLILPSLYMRVHLHSAHQTKVSSAWRDASGRARVMALSDPLGMLFYNLLKYWLRCSRPVSTKHAYRNVYLLFSLYNGHFRQ